MTAPGMRPSALELNDVTTILAFLFVLGVLVFVHELGHFLAARRIGVRVLDVFARLRTEVAVDQARRH